MTWPGWEHELLGGLGIQSTVERMRFLEAWARAEGGGARFNPLNTTMGVPGAEDYNSVHVRHYPDAIAGIAATLLTLRLAAYRPLLVALRSKGLSAEQITQKGARSLTTWGTGSRLILEVLREI